VFSPTAILGESWRLYRGHWQHLIPIALVVYALLGLISLVLTATLGWVGALVGALVSIVGIFWLQGALVEAVADVRDGRADLSIGQTFSKAKERLSSVAVAGILAGLAITIGLLLLIVPGLFLMTIWAVIIPVIVLEQRSAGEAFSRSRELVRGNGWNVFGLIVLVVLVLFAATIVLSILLFWLPDGLGAYIRDLISNSLTAPFIAVALTLAYFRLREREAPAEQPAQPIL
jgi:hypothetical protein